MPNSEFNSLFNNYSDDFSDKATQQPKMMTIREVAATGLLPETALRRLNKEHRLPSIQVGTVTYINYQALVHMLDNLGKAV